MLGALRFSDDQVLCMIVVELIALVAPVMRYIPLEQVYEY